MKNNPHFLLWHKRTNSDFYFRCFPFWSFISVTWQQMICTSLHVDSLIFSPAENGCGAWKCQRDFPEGGRGCCPCKSEFDLLPDEQLDYFSCCQALAQAQRSSTRLCTVAVKHVCGFCSILWNITGQMRVQEESNKLHKDSFLCCGKEATLKCWRVWSWVAEEACLSHAMLNGFFLIGLSPHLQLQLVITICSQERSWWPSELIWCICFSFRMCPHPVESDPCPRSSFTRMAKR